MVYAYATDFRAGKNVYSCGEITGKLKSATWVREGRDRRLRAALTERLERLNSF